VADFFETGGANIAFEVAGDAAAGDPWVTCLHSVGLSTREGWRAQIPALARRYSVLSLDFRGFGQSTKGEAEICVATFAADLAVLMDHLGVDRTVLMGVSLGGFVAQAFALDHPERVSALVLVSTACRIAVGNSGARARRNARIRAQGMAAVADQQIASHFPDDFQADQPDVMAWYRRHYLANDPESYVAIMEDLGRFDCCARLPEIRCPTLVVAGAADTSAVAGKQPGAAARVLADAIGGARLEIITGAHHYPQIDHGSAFNRGVADFLGGLDL
jgi:3-oxoadipate enol-lactonase